mmetsp:Transcript_13970/g.52163  ORF Transcript_13970/g.52163 Transcript_13970/m.52163 type:complete len:306 (+) Transcript_13970:96-1013(+)
MLRSRVVLGSVKKVGVVGLGLMGHGIAQTVAWEGFEVVGVESSQKSLELGQQRIDESLQKILKTAAKKQPDSLAEKEQRSQETKARISYSTDRGALHDCDVVIEAVVEDMAVKTPLYQELHALCKPETLLCSNTSSLPIQAIAEASGRPQKTIGLHFFNPVQIMRLVEVVKLPETDPADFEMMVQFVRDINKTPVTCVDTPGFIVNRLLVPALAQAMMMLERGHASKEDIDTAMQLGAGHPMGPLTLADYVGLDTCKFILEGWVDRYPEEPAFFVPQCLKDKVAEGKLGRKTGEGFFKWDGMKRL